MNNTTMKFLFGAILAAALFAMSVAAQAQLDLSDKILSSTKEKVHDPQLLEGIGAYEKNNFVAASEIFETFAARGDAIAQFYLGRIYMQGLGSFKPDYSKALELTRKAAKQGLAEAEELLGFLYYYGLGVPQDNKLAVEWLRKAALHGVAEAQDNLGYLYEKGQGVPQDWVQAYQWYSLGKKTGEESAEIRIKNAAANMTPQQMAEAEALQARMEEEIRLKAAAKVKATEEMHAASNSNDVLKAINEWAAAWSSQNVERYLAFYAEDFKTPDGESRSAWEEQRHKRISSPKSIHVGVSNPKVKFIDDGHASVSFKQVYHASHLKTSSAKTLVLVKSGSRWLIQEEHSEK